MNENRKRKLLLICLALFCLTFLRVDILKAQEPPADTTRWAIKTNLLGWATTSVNLAGEVTLDGRRVCPGDVGLAFQRPEDQLFCDTVLDDIAYGPRAQGLAEEEALAAGALRK